ncbi:hypothetical protein, partial [Streptomyces sp. WAC06614]|uniref:hypothetical protein n=1 Tax=Streptomyces sp. WAC06614 TaxID=2487416 RepID=UPI000FBC8A49
MVTLRAGRGLWPDRQVSKAFGRDLGDLLGASQPYLSAGAKGFRGTGAGTFADTFARRTADIFEKRLGGALGKEAARSLGEKYGQAFTRNWGRAGADHAALSQALHGVLRNSGLDKAGIKALTAGVPAAATGMGAGSLGFRLGQILGASVGSGVHNSVTEGFYTLIFTDEHRFDVSWQGFVSGLSMGLLGKVQHEFIAAPLGARWARAWHDMPSLREIVAKVRAAQGPDGAAGLPGPCAVPSVYVYGRTDVPPPSSGVRSSPPPGRSPSASCTRR